MVPNEISFHTIEFFVNKGWFSDIRARNHHEQEGKEDKKQVKKEQNPGPPPPLCLLFRQNMDGAWNGVRMDQRVFYSAYNQPYHQNIHLTSIFAYRTNDKSFSGYKGVGYRINPATGPIWGGQKRGPYTRNRVYLFGKGVRPYKIRAYVEVGNGVFRSCVDDFSPILTPPPRRHVKSLPTRGLSIWRVYRRVTEP